MPAARTEKEEESKQHEPEQKKMVEAITPPSTKISQWYTDICLKAELVIIPPSRGCVILRPYGYAIWENIMHLLDAL